MGRCADRERAPVDRRDCRSSNGRECIAVAVIRGRGVLIECEGGCSGEA